MENSFDEISNSKVFCVGQKNISLIFFVWSNSKLILKANHMIPNSAGKVFRGMVAAESGPQEGM
jgi:hypothetical protein